MRGWALHIPTYHGCGLWKPAHVFGTSWHHSGGVSEVGFFPRFGGSTSDCGLRDLVGNSRTYDVAPALKE